MSKKGDWHVREGNGPTFTIAYLLLSGFAFEVSSGIQERKSGVRKQVNILALKKDEKNLCVYASKFLSALGATNEML